MRTRIVVLAMCWAAVAAAVETEPCERWDDIGTNLALPEEIAGMRMQTRAEYGKDDTTFCYGSREFVAGTDGRRVLTFYLYKRAGVELEADGVGDDVRKELAYLVKAVQVRLDSAFTSVEVLEMGRLGKIGGTDCLTAEFVYKAGKSQRDMRGWALVCSFMGRFLKLRYSECVTDADGKERPSSWPEVVKAVGELMDRAKRDRAVDVYAVVDATNRLAALRRKWVGADNRVSMWKMPNYGEKYLELHRILDWCDDNPEERYQLFEQCAREAIELRIDLPYWYYNLSCSLAVQNKTEDAFDALEQAVAAGYGAEGKADHARRDSDLVSLTNDTRFASLCAAMDADVRRAAAGPQRLAEENDGFVRLSNDNVYFALGDAVYSVHLLTSNECPVVYVNHHENHPDIPCEGLINAIYPEEAHDERRDIAYADIRFLDYDRSCRLQGSSYCPTIVASDWVYGHDWLNGSTSVPAGYGASSANAMRECQLQTEWNVLGVYSAAADYWTDGIDRFVGWCPSCIAYVGGPEEADKFVVLFRDIVRALPESFRASAALLAPNLIRHGQRCVKTEADFMSGKAQRPALRFADIDVTKVLDAAAGMSSDAPWPMTPLLDPVKARALSGLPVTDLLNDPYGRSLYAISVYNATFFARGAERTFRAAVGLHPVKTGRFQWRVLQGDEEKVRILPKAEDMSEIELEVDYHTVFDVELSDGTKQKTSRVDVGCFLVDTNGVASVPAVVSVYFSPNETREYGSDGRLVSIDYTKRQLERFCPSICSSGDWKDDFHWTDDGELSGWMRTYADGPNLVVTNEFTRDGFVIDACDAQGRPKDVHRSLRSTWMQTLEPTNMTGDAAAEELGWCGHRHDFVNGDLETWTLAWQYAYEDDADRFGKPSPKPHHPFRYRPELCRRADFEGSGFRLPLVSQLGFGYDLYAGYKHDRLNENVGDLLREDSRAALEGEGLTPPKVLKKMKFCPWAPSSNDVWKVDVEELEKDIGNQLRELADGSYRAYCPETETNGEVKVSVGQTFRNVNRIVEAFAYKKLDGLYRRLDSDEVRKRFGDYMERDKTIIVTGEPVDEEGLSEDAESGFSAWRITEDCYLCVVSDLQEGFRSRMYCLMKTDRDDDTVRCVGVFNELPSRAIGNTALSSTEDDPAALNNYAVLLYAEIANRRGYNEEAVTVMLEKSAKLGNATAVYNLGVMAENRGEKSMAARRYEEARVMGFKPRP